MPVGTDRRPGRSSVSPLWKHARRLKLELICFPLVAAAYAVHLFLLGYDRFHHDSLNYWWLGWSFTSQGHFSLATFNEQGSPYGYGFPLVVNVLQHIAASCGLGSVTVVKLFGSLLAATLGVIVLPRLARRLFPSASIGVGRVLALNALIFLFWRDHFNFPLSDFPTLLVAAVGLLGLLRASPSGYLVAGLGVGLAANMRSAFLPALLAVILVAVFRSGSGLQRLHGLQLRRRGAATALVLAGAFVVFLPQMLINHHQRSSWSPMVFGAKDVSLLQLSDGLVAQKYETFVGPATKYPQPQVFYLDPATTRVLERNSLPTTIVDGRNNAITSYGQYARIALENPLVLAASYGRHVFNGFDVRYPTPYVSDLGDDSILLSLLLYTLMFLAAARLLLPDARRALGRVRWLGVIVLVSPCLTAIPGAIEPRFFLPLHVLVYMLVCFAPASWASLLGRSSARRIGVAASYAAFVLVCFALSSATLAHLQYPESQPRPAGTP